MAADVAADLEPVRVERATKASRVFAVLAAVVLAALISLPWWGDAGWMRLIAEMAYYVALAQLWNLLAGYAGLVSVGQQAYVGLGGYMLFYLTGVWNMNVYLALLLAGPFAGLMSIPGLVRGVSAARRLFRHRHLGRVRSLFADREPHSGARRRLRTVAHRSDLARNLRPTATCAIRCSI